MSLLLYRPVGLLELQRIAESGWREFPPRLEGQPIFYPVLSRDYAVQIARDWNVTDPSSGFAGFVTEFAISSEIADRYPVQVVGGSEHRELWVPAEELDAFNRGIEGEIAVVESIYGAQYTGAKPPF